MNRKNTITALSAAVALALASSAFAAPSAGAAAQAASPAWLAAAQVKKFDFAFRGDILDALATLNSQYAPGSFTILSPSGQISSVPVDIHMTGATLEDALRAIGEAGGDKADLQVMRNGYVRIAFRAPLVLPESAKTGGVTGSFTVEPAKAGSMGVGLESVPTPKCIVGCDNDAPSAKAIQQAKDELEARRQAEAKTAAPAPVVKASAPTRYVAKKSKATLVPDTFDFMFKGDIQDAVLALRELQPQLVIMPSSGPVVRLPVQIELRNASLLDVLKALDEQSSGVANVIYTGSNQRLRLAFRTQSNYGENSVNESKKWQGGGNPRPILGADGLLQFPFGEYQPEITCAPLRACDIELQAGELVNNVIVGDSVRWIAAPAKTGDGSAAIPHVIIKPTDKGLQTNLVVTTNRRTYVMTLKSSDLNYVSRAGFYYPRDMVQDWTDQAEVARRKAAEDDAKKVSDLPLVSADQLQFGYKLSGDKDLAWYPVRVFDDGTRVFIQMSQAMKSSEAPALVLLDKSGNSELVNYRVKDSYYIVDKLFTKAALIVGVGSDQQKIEITKNGKGSSGFSLFGSN